MFTQQVLQPRSPEAANRYRVAKRAAALVVAEAKMQEFEEIREDI